jgi:hypothetical protein
MHISNCIVYARIAVLTFLIKQAVDEIKRVG